MRLRRGIAVVLSVVLTALSGGPVWAQTVRVTAAPAGMPVLPGLPQNGLGAPALMNAPLTAPALQGLTPLPAPSVVPSALTAQIVPTAAKPVVASVQDNPRTALIPGAFQPAARTANAPGGLSAASKQIEALSLTAKPVLEGVKNGDAALALNAVYENGSQRGELGSVRGPAALSAALRSGLKKSAPSASRKESGDVPAVEAEPAPKPSRIPIRRLLEIPFYPVYLFTVLPHEGAHYLAAKLLGGRNLIFHINGSVFAGGGYVEYNGIDSPARNAIVALAGPLVGILASAALAAGGIALGPYSSLAGFLYLTIGATAFVQNIIGSKSDWRAAAAHLRGAPSRRPEKPPNEAKEEWKLKPAQSAVVALKERGNPLKYPLGIADKVQLQFRGEALEAYFLGKKNDFFFFHERENGRLITISEHDISLLDTERNLIEKDKAQRILIVEKQVGPTCAVHSTVNCLVVLKEFGLLKESELKTSLEQNPKAVFESLNVINEEAKRLMLAGMPLISGVAFQSELRQSVLRSHGLETQITHSIGPLKRHLKKGFPAILDLLVKPGSRRVEVLHKETYISHEVSTLLPSKRGEPDSLGGHSVVAIAYIETGFFSGHILILDSATAEFHLWDIHRMKAAIKSYGSITLVQP